MLLGILLCTTSSHAFTHTHTANKELSLGFSFFSDCLTQQRAIVDAETLDVEVKREK
jgi:hypothetical protein